MTLPYEQYDAMNGIRNFLTTLQDIPNLCPTIKTEARNLLENYPSKGDAAEMVELFAERHEPRPYVVYSAVERGWVFWDETATVVSKAFPTKTAATDAFNEYCKTLTP